MIQVGRTGRTLYGRLGYIGLIFTLPSVSVWRYRP